jgi:hypothetical protein
MLDAVRFGLRWLGGSQQATRGATAAEPNAEPPAPPVDAELPPRAAATGGAAAASAPSPLRSSPRRQQAPPRPALSPGRASERDTGAAAGLDAGKASQSAPTSLRPLAALRATEGCDLAARLRKLGVPTGPWASDQDAKTEINKWARDLKASEGGFSTVWGSLTKAAGAGSRARGRLHTLVCHNHAADKGKCGWSITLEECVEGWAIRSYHPHDGAESASGHNHALMRSAVEARARCSMREIPADLIEVGKAMVLCGVSKSKVYRFLKWQVEKSGAEAMFTSQDVYHACGVSTGERRLDATNLQELLRTREVEEGLYQRTTTDEDGCLDKVFFELQGATGVYSNEPERQVVEIDHKARALTPAVRLCPARLLNRARTQHGTNKHGLKMMLWVTVDGSGATKILACSLMVDEGLESAAWSCQCFSDCFRVPPAVIFSDSAPALKAAVASVFPTSKHLSCVWHLSNNMLTHLRPACGADIDLWHRVRSKWWHILKNTDESSCASFASEWAALGAMLNASTATIAVKEAARAWLDKCGEDCERWAYRFTWRYFTLGLHSTQRIEAVHAAIVHFLSQSTLLTDLVPHLESYAQDVTVRASVREYKHIKRILDATGACLPHPFIAALAEKLTGYALVMFKAQLQQSQFYVAAAVPETDSFTVTRRPGSWGVERDAETQSGDAEVGISAPLFTTPRRTSLNACSCQFPVCYGMPCRHMLYLHTISQRELRLELFDARWKQRLPEAELAAVQALLRRRAPRAPPGPAAQLDRAERYALIMAAARGVAAVGAETAGGYTAACDGLTQLLSALRKPAAGPAPAPRSRTARAAAAPAAAAAEGAAGGGVPGPTCRSCWGRLPFPHNKNNRLCPNYGNEPLEDPHEYAPARTVRRGGALPLLAEADSSEEEAEADEADEDGNDNTCKVCDKTGDLYECDKCPRSWHHDCLPLAALPLLDAEPWHCPTCAGIIVPTGFVGNPRRAPPGRGGVQQRKRLRPATEGTRGQRKRAKAAGRTRETRYR